MKEDYLPKKEPSLNVNIFRHGEAKYNQKDVSSIEEAEDLTIKGIEDAKKSAEELANFIKPNEEVEIWSSPTGRTLQTSKVISQVLEKKGISIRKNRIKIFKQFSEVKNFSWKLFYPLVVGGEVEFAGKKFFIDKNLTNPNNLSPSEYFSESGIKYIDLSYKQKLPEEYVREIEGIEDFIDVTKRLMRPLSHLKNIKDKPHRIIIVTHDALSGFIANVFSYGEMNGINPGEFINLERKAGKLVITKVGNLDIGNSDLDVIDEFNHKAT